MFYSAQTFAIYFRSWIAVIARYGRCKFEDKVRFAMEANFSAVIVYNVESNKVIPDEYSDEVTNSFLQKILYKKTLGTVLKFR